MLITEQKLIGLAVKTRSQQGLGRIRGFAVELGSQSIHEYYVKPAGVANIFSNELIINREQVIVITPEAMIVDDAVYRKAEQEQKFQKEKKAAAAGALSAAPK